MKKVSAKVFFAVVWRGLCQTLGWFFGLFGYKRDGKFAKCVWGLFATSAAVITAIMAVALIYAIGENYYRQNYMEAHCYDPSCYHANSISEYVCYHERDKGEGYVYNTQTGKKTLKDILWIAEPAGKDSLICFNNGKKRGYFNKFTGEVVIEPKYDHAWIFSDGLACVDDGGHVKFIDATGKVVIDHNKPYIPDMGGYVFHGGFCVVDTDDGEKHGLIDTTGRIVLPLEYSDISQTDDYQYWHVQKGEEYGILDNELKPIVPLMECTSMEINDGTVDVTMPDHSIRKYDMQGTLINDFLITSVRMLEYEKEEIKYEPREYGDIDNATVEMGTYHTKGTARLRAYVAGDGYEGLMTADGHKVTMPLYWDIVALDHDLYICAMKNGDKVIVNGKGEIVN